MGVTLRQIVEEVGGGVAPGRQFKAVQVGGPSGGCVPAELADTPVDFEALTRGRRDHGERRTGRARRLRLHGRHRPLLPPLHPRPVLRQVHVLPRRHEAHARDPRSHLCRARAAGRPGRLESAGPSVVAGSLCGLGRTAPNPVLSTLRYFRDEYEAHLRGPLSRRQVQGPDSLRDHRRLHRLHALRPALSGRRHPLDALRRHRIDMDRARAATRAGKSARKTRVVRRSPRESLQDDILPTDHRRSPGRGPAGSDHSGRGRAVGHRDPHALFSQRLRSFHVLPRLRGQKPAIRGSSFPACATRVVDGMRLDHATEEVAACAVRPWNCS